MLRNNSTTRAARYKWFAVCFPCVNERADVDCGAIWGDKLEPPPKAMYRFEIIAVFLGGRHS